MITVTKVIPQSIINSGEEKVSDWINEWILDEYENNGVEITINTIKQIATNGTPINLIIYQAEPTGKSDRIFKIVKFQSPIDKTTERIRDAFELISKLYQPDINHFTFIDDHASRELDHIIIVFSYIRVSQEFEDSILSKIYEL